MTWNGLWTLWLYYTTHTDFRFYSSCIAHAGYRKFSELRNATEQTVWTLPRIFSKVRAVLKVSKAATHVQTGIRRATIQPSRRRRLSDDSGPVGLGPQVR